MEWWLYPIVIYCSLTYVLGIFICLFYLIGNAIGLAHPKVHLKDLYWGAIIYILVSPIFVPWWISEFIKANKGG